MLPAPSDTLCPMPSDSSNIDALISGLAPGSLARALVEVLRASPQPDWATALGAKAAQLIDSETKRIGDATD